MSGHKSRQSDGSWTHCDGPVSYIAIPGANGRGGLLSYRCDGCGKTWDVS